MNTKWIEIETIIIGNKYYTTFKLGFLTKLSRQYLNFGLYN